MPPSTAIADVLESRQMFAGSPSGYVYSTSVGRASFHFQDGVLYVQGSGQGDTLVPVISHGRLSFEDQVTSRFRASRGGISYQPIVYDTNGTPVTFPSIVPPGRLVSDPFIPRLADVRKLVIDLGDGSDTVDLSRLSIPAEVHGGVGNDTIVGSAASDTLYGDSGNDEITDGRGSDLLAGGQGNDVLRSRRGPDTLLGQTGDDMLYAYATKAVVNGGAGTDSVYLAAAPDAIAGAEKAVAASALQITPVRVHPAATTATLRRNGDGLTLDVSLTLATAGFGVDWDLTKNTDGEVIADATVYVPTGASGQAFTSYSTSFDLGQTFVHRGVTVRVRQGGTDVLAGHALVTRGFHSESFVDGDEELIPARSWSPPFKRLIEEVFPI